jgi:hypothetical protein
MNVSLSLLYDGNNMGSSAKGDQREVSPPPSSSSLDGVITPLSCHIMFAHWSLLFFQASLSPCSTPWPVSISSDTIVYGKVLIFVPS